MPHELLRGLQHFREVDLPRYRSLYRRLADEGQRPAVLFVACSDSRIVPNLLTGTGPGELFIVRTVANVVLPPGAGPDPTLAALEFAVHALGVRDVVVCGHSRCGGVAALYAPPPAELAHLAAWVDQASAARLDEATRDGLDDAEVDRRTGQRNVLLSLDRLAAHPLVAERRAAGELTLHGWYLDVGDQDVEVFDPATGQFGAPADLFT